MKVSVAVGQDQHSPLDVGHSATPCVHKSWSQRLLVGAVQCVTVDGQDKYV